MNINLRAGLSTVNKGRFVALGAVLVSVVIVGCSVQPLAVVPAKTENSTSSSHTSIPPTGQVFEPSARTNAAYLSPAAKELVAKARRYSGDGDSASALRYLERAQRISPRAPQVYLAMAEVRLQQGQNGQARQLANKALSLVGEDEDLRQAAELFLHGL